MAIEESSGVSKAIVPPCTSPSRIRLLQHRPAWRLHALLRFLNIPYECENCELPYAMGQQLPLLIDGNFIFTERLAAEHIASGRITEEYSLVGTIATNNASSEQNNIIDDEQTGIDSNQSVSLINTLTDISMSSFIDNNLAEVTHRVKCSYDNSGREAVKGLQGLTRHIYSFSSGSSGHSLFSTIFTKSNFFRTQQDRYQEGAYSYYLNDKLVLEKKLEQIYKLLTLKLVSNGGEMLSGSKRFGVAEAALFAHLAEALSHPQLRLRAMNQTSLMTFFKRVCGDFFLHPNQAISSWACAAKEIAQNSFLKDDVSQTFLKEYIINVGEQISPFYEKNSSDETRLMKVNLFYNASDDTSNSIVLGYYGCIYLSAIFASFGVYFLRVNRKQ